MSEGKTHLGEDVVSRLTRQERDTLNIDKKTADWEVVDCPTHPGIECEYNTDSLGRPECPCTEECCRIEVVNDVE